MITAGRLVDQTAPSLPPAKECKRKENQNNAPATDVARKNAGVTGGSKRRTMGITRKRVVDRKADGIPIASSEQTMVKR